MDVSDNADRYGWAAQYLAGNPEIKALFDRALVGDGEADENGEPIPWSSERFKQELAGSNPFRANFPPETFTATHAMIWGPRTLNRRERLRQRLSSWLYGLAERVEPSTTQILFSQDYRKLALDESRIEQGDDGNAQVRPPTAHAIVPKNQQRDGTDLTKVFPRRRK